MKNLKKIYHSLVLFSVPLCWKLEQLVKWSFLQQTLQDWKVLNKLTFHVSLTTSVLWTAGQGAVAYNQFFTASACWNNSITQWHVTFCRRKNMFVKISLQTGTRVGGEKKKKKDKRTEEKMEERTIFQVLFTNTDKFWLEEQILWALFAIPIQLNDVLRKLSPTILQWLPKSAFHYESKLYFFLYPDVLLCIWLYQN